MRGFAYARGLVAALALCLALALALFAVGAAPAEAHRTYPCTTQTRYHEHANTSGGYAVWENFQYSYRSGGRTYHHVRYTSRSIYYGSIISRYGYNVAC